MWQERQDMREVIQRLLGNHVRGMLSYSSFVLLNPTWVSLANRLVKFSYISRHYWSNQGRSIKRMSGWPPHLIMCTCGLLHVDPLPRRASTKSRNEWMCPVNNYKLTRSALSSLVSFFQNMEGWPGVPIFVLDILWMDTTMYCWSSKTLVVTYGLAAALDGWIM